MIFANEDNILCIASNYVYLELVKNILIITITVFRGFEKPHENHLNPLHKHEVLLIPTYIQMYLLESIRCRVYVMSEM